MDSAARQDQAIKRSPQAQPVARAILSWREVQVMTGLARNTVRAEMNRGHFPAQRQITPGRRGFLASEVDQWLLNRPKVADAADGQPHNSGVPA